MRERGRNLTFKHLLDSSNEDEPLFVTTVAAYNSLLPQTGNADISFMLK